LLKVGFRPLPLFVATFHWTASGKSGRVKVVRGMAGPTPIRTQPPPQPTLSP
jgi:hypothetical protein